MKITDPASEIRLMLAAENGSEEFVQQDDLTHYMKPMDEI